MGTEGMGSFPTHRKMMGPSTMNPAAWLDPETSVWAPMSGWNGHEGRYGMEAIHGSCVLTCQRMMAEHAVQVIVQQPVSTQTHMSLIDSPDAPTGHVSGAEDLFHTAQRSASPGNELSGRMKS